MAMDKTGTGEGKMIHAIRRRVEKRQLCKSGQEALASFCKRWWNN
jgi:hypothetical protein